VARSLSSRRAALEAIERHGALLVFPIQNRPEPLSLWRVLHPRSRMRWEWDETGDDRVVALWRLREELARSRKVVYAKWYQNRATFFSRRLFTAMLADLRATGDLRRGLAPDARDILRELESDSPISTKQLRGLVDLQGRAFEATWQGALRTLFSRLSIVGFGEVDDGAFPSLAVGATRVLFEDLWDESSELEPDIAARTVAELLPAGSKLGRHHAKILGALRRAGAGISVLERSVLELGPAHVGVLRAAEDEWPEHADDQEHQRRDDHHHQRRPRELLDAELADPRERAVERGRLGR
jgi:hypothetical protein